MRFAQCTAVKCSCSYSVPVGARTNLTIVFISFTEGSKSNFVGKFSRDLDNFSSTVVSLNLLCLPVVEKVCGGIKWRDQRRSGKLPR